MQDESPPRGARTERHALPVQVREIMPPEPAIMAAFEAAVTPVDRAAEGALLALLLTFDVEEDDLRFRGRIEGVTACPGRSARLQARELRFRFDLLERAAPAAMGLSAAIEESLDIRRALGKTAVPFRSERTGIARYKVLAHPAGFIAAPVEQVPDTAPRAFCDLKRGLAVMRVKDISAHARIGFLSEVGGLACEVLPGLEGARLCASVPA